MLYLGGLFLLVAFISTGLFAFWLMARPAYAHAMFALAALPLMLGAIQHFVPVLTRSGAPARALRTLPWMAGSGGAVAVMSGAQPRQLLLLAALIVGGAAVFMLIWIRGRMRRCLGAPHAGVRWYFAALVVLLLGMLAVFGTLLDPARFLAWRVAHVHLNLLGWIGLTALGTLPVLLPTSVPGNNLQKNVTRAARRLDQLLWPALAGVLVIALAAATGLGTLGAGGAAILALVVALHLRAWMIQYGALALRSGTAASLSLATIGWITLMLAGADHGLRSAGGAVMVGALVFGFLLPLVLGALAQLLPVWRYPGPESPPRVLYRLALADRAAVRAALCLLAAILHFFGFVWAPFLALAAVLHLAITALVGARARAGL